jgi:hypothetical protein
MKERLTFFQVDADNVYYFVYLPINYDTSVTSDSVIKISAILTVELDRHRLSEAFALREPDKKESDQFSLVMFNLKHYLASTENIRHSFRIEIAALDLIEPYKFSLSMSKAPKAVYLSFLIENCIRDKSVFFEIVDTDILIEEPVEIINKKFVKKDTKIIEFIDYFIFNKNVGSEEGHQSPQWRKGKSVFQAVHQPEDRGESGQGDATGGDLSPLSPQKTERDPRVSPDSQRPEIEGPKHGRHFQLSDQRSRPAPARVPPKTAQPRQGRFVHPGPAPNNGLRKVQGVFQQLQGGVWQRRFSTQLFHSTASQVRRGRAQHLQEQSDHYQT